MTKKGEPKNLPLNDEVDFLGKFRNGQGLGNEDKTVVGNPNQESVSVQSVRERKRLKREKQAQIANIQTLMGLSKNLNESVKNALN